MVTRDTTLWVVGCQRKSVKNSRFEGGMPFGIRDQSYALGRALISNGVGLPEGANFGKVMLRFF
jgi:hypothetical protein